MNRGWATHGKETRRLRLWLKPETWAAIEEKARELDWADKRDQVAVERILEEWARSQLDWANRAGASPDPVKEAWRSWHTNA